MWDHYISFEWLEELCLIVQTLWTLEVALKVQIILWFSIGEVEYKIQMENMCQVNVMLNITHIFLRCGFVLSYGNSFELNLDI